MPRGKKTPPEVVEKVIASLAVTDSTRQTARDTNVPESTVRGICKDNNDEFAQIRAEQRKEIIQRMWNIAAKGTKLMERKMDKISEDESGAALAAIDMREISTPTATMIDKALLMEGKPTEIIGGNLNFGDF